MNGVMMQYFHWYNPADGALWDQVAARAPELAQAGFTALWLPPAYKGAGGADDVGYGVYDMYDLGEFDQKGSVRTKYGTREKYLAAIQALHKAGLQVYADTVLNHRLGADDTELVVRRDQPLSAAVEHVERALIQDALRVHPNVEDAARGLPVDWFVSDWAVNEERSVLLDYEHAFA